jgi:pimeloyl-ACP methyl ester carboxylesterase
VKIHYLTAGTTGSWVVLIHGYSDNADRMWFRTGIAPALAKNHRIVALDNRNHGKSDKPQPGGSGKAQDVVELMDHLKIDRAHIHGYSMGGGMTGQLLAMIPQRFITAGFGGSGIQETDPKLRAQAQAMDEALPKATGEDRRRWTVSAAASLSLARRARRHHQRRRSRSTSRSSQSRFWRWNGSFDNPYAKTQRIWREAPLFQNVILAGKTHLTAISSNGAPPLYIEAMTKFIDAYDKR